MVYLKRNRMRFYTTLVSTLLCALTAPLGLASLSEAGTLGATLPTPDSFLKRLENSVRSLHSYAVTHSQIERFGNQLGPKMKMRSKHCHGRTYLKMLEGPKKDAEVIYVPGWNHGKVKVHKGSFPDLTLSLDPHGSLMMDDQHHPIEHGGLDYVVGTLVKTTRACRNFPGSTLRILNPQTLELVAPWKEKMEQVLKDESIWSFATRLSSDPFLILQTNHIKDWDDVEQGMKLKIPTCYAGRTLLTVDPVNHLPRKLTTFDWKGQLYEEYEWQDLDRTTLISDADFDPKNRAYGF